MCVCDVLPHAQASSAVLSPFLVRHRQWPTTFRQLLPLTSILVVANRWMKLHSTHRVTSPFVRALQQRWNVTLHFSASAHFNASTAEVAGFSHVRFLRDDHSEQFLANELQWMVDQRFDVIFFPEVSVCGL